MTLLDAALDYATHGCSVIPVRADGSKAPAVAWKPYQAAAADEDTLAAWFTGDTYDGLGIVTGAASGNLELLELEGRATHLLPELAQLLCDSGLADLWQAVSQGWVVRSPSGGIHLLYRVDGPVHGNTKLARRPNAEDPHLVDVLIETRGEAGYFVTAPSGGRTHPTGGAWTLLAGGPAMCPTITGEQRDALHIAAATFDAMPAAEPLPVASAPSTPSEGRRPGDDYNDRATWDDILTPHGWTKTKRIGAGLGWTRPGKHARDGISATTGTSADGVDRLYVFSSSTEFDTERPYSKFAAYAVLEHGGDLSAAAKALRAAGYGDQTRPARDGILALVGGPAPMQQAPSHGEQTPGRARPRLDVSNNAAAAEWLRTNVGTGPLSGMFLRGLDIVHTPRVGEDGYIALVKPPPGGPAVDDDGPAQVRVVKKSTLASRIQYAYDCYKLIKRDGEFIETPAIFPVDAARVAADVPDELAGLRPLAGVIHAPVLRHDGTILATPGYDPSTQLLHLPAATLELPDIPEAPTPDDVAGAVALLDEMTAGFPFVTEHDRANYYGALLTPILRAIAPAPYKLVAITAPQPGSGKTLLATCVRLIHGGVFRAEFPEDDAELRKQITSILTVTTGHLLLGDDVGLGKTFSSLLLLRDPDTLPAVVVTLTHLPRQWQRELEASLPWLTSHIPTKGTAYDVDADVVILNYAKLAGWADHLAGQVRTVIFDEVQELRRGASAKYFAAQQIADAALWRMGLSATPVYNYGGEIHSIYQCLAPDRLGTRDEFVREWGGREWNGNVQVRDPGGLGAWLRDEGLLLRRTRKDVHRELPEPIRIVHEVDTDATALEAVKDDVAALAQLIRDRTTSTQAERFTAAGELDWMLRQATGVAKAPYVAQFVRLLLESEERVVLFGWHHDVYAIWMNALSDFRPVLYTGRETPAKKQTAFEAFTRPLDSPGFTSRVLIMSLRAGAGLDGLQDHASVVVFGELDWSPATHDQCIGRLARDGQEATVAAYYLVAAEGSDPTISEVLQLKRQQAEPIRNPDAPLLTPVTDNGDRITRLVDAVLDPTGGPDDAP